MHNYKSVDYRQINYPRLGFWLFKISIRSKSGERLKRLVLARLSSLLRFAIRLGWKIAENS